MNYINRSELGQLLRELLELIDSATDQYEDEDGRDWRLQDFAKAQRLIDDWVNQK